MADARASASKESFSLDFVYDTRLEFPGRVALLLEQAASRWEEVISEGLPDVQSAEGAPCGEFFELPRHVDDVLVFVALVSIDGPGNVLGVGVPCIRRAEGSRLPVAGLLELDISDVDALGTSVVAHELGHVLGLGTLWQQFVLGGTHDAGVEARSMFLGKEATKAYHTEGGDGPGVPLEGGDLPGSPDAHWLECAFGDEVMSARVGAEEKVVISRTSIGALGDIGYSVNPKAADPFFIYADSACRD